MTDNEQRAHDFACAVISNSFLMDRMSLKNNSNCKSRPTPLQAYSSLYKEFLGMNGEKITADEYL